MDYWGETMDYCFSRLEERINDAIERTDIQELFNNLKGIDAPTIATGVGGSGIVSSYFCKVLSAKNSIICTDVTPRDLLYKPLNGYKNVIACSYSGKNIGVKASFSNDLKKYLFSINAIDGAVPLQYRVGDEEESFISVAGTLIPMSLLFLYYTDCDLGLLKEILHSGFNWECLPASRVVEVLYGYEQCTAAKLLESTMTEGGLAAPVLHDKYDYCHGRCKLNDSQNNDLIYFSAVNELDDLFDKELPLFYDSVTVMNCRYEDIVINDFYLSYASLLLCKKMAEAKGKDLSKKIVPDISEKLYLFSGQLK